MSKSFPQQIDARFTNLNNSFSEDKSGNDLKFVVEKLFGDTARLEEVDHLTHKYLISTDGCVAAWLRPVWIMASNSVLLFQHKFEQWFYPSLKAWVHYVPIKDDISNILEIHKWLITHDVEAKKISENANKLVENALLPEHIEEDLAFILNGYAAIQKFELRKPTLPEYRQLQTYQSDGKLNFKDIIRWLKDKINLFI